jgi:diaminohydroxyphosphoribosylaminopyrimidine deaminase / 5-amino-6-(5-phosphoribosylamino)uracil reductase
MDSRQRLDPDSKLVRSAPESPVILLTTRPPSPPLVRAGVEVIQIHTGRDGRVSLRHALTTLRDRGLMSLLVEGGGEVAGSFLRADAVDRIEWFRAPILLGRGASRHRLAGRRRARTGAPFPAPCGGALR